MRYDVKNLQINRQIVLTKKNKRNTSSEQNVVFPFVLPRKSQTIVKKKKENNNRWPLDRLF